MKESTSVTATFTVQESDISTNGSSSESEKSSNVNDEKSINQRNVHFNVKNAIRIYQFKG